LSNPCTGAGNTDTHVCSGCVPTPANCDDADCDTGVCNTCAYGWLITDNGFGCYQDYCILYGCGYSQENILCEDETTYDYTCICPNDVFGTKVEPTNYRFEGCTGEDTLTISAIFLLVQADEAVLDANLRNAISDIISVTVVSVEGDTITLSVTSVNGIASFEEAFRLAISDFLALPGIRKDDIVWQPVGARRDVTEIVAVTIQPTISGSASLSGLVGLGLVFIVSLLQ